MKNLVAHPPPESAPAREIRVLLVDDSALARAALVEMLANCPGIRIAGQAENGLEGFALAAGLQPDLVITDLQMPGRDGFQLAELLRQTYPAMRLIIISSHEGSSFKAASLRHGADAFISKRRLVEELPRRLTALFPGVAGPATIPCKA